MPVLLGNRRSVSQRSMRHFVRGIVRARFMIISHISRMLLVVDFRFFSEERPVLFLLGHPLEVSNLALYLRLDVCQAPWQRDSGELILSSISIGIPCLRFVLWNDVACQRSLASGLLCSTMLVTVSPTFMVSLRASFITLVYKVVIGMYLQRHIMSIVSLFLI